MSKTIPETLGDYADIIDELPPEVSASAKLFIAKKIAASPRGRDDVVIADPNQMFHLIGALVEKDVEKLG